jgi:hypothetical protein
MIDCNQEAFFGLNLALKLTILPTRHTLFHDRLSLIAILAQQGNNLLREVFVNFDLHSRLLDRD